MTKRLQVLLDDAELREIQRVARSQRVTVAEWVRQVLRAARRSVRAAARHSFPAPDIDRMLAEIERGYGGEAPK